LTNRAQEFAVSDAIRVVDAQHFDRGSSNSRLAKKRRVSPFEMIVPIVDARVEQR
jgi:hypothetical protein